MTTIQQTHLEYLFSAIPEIISTETDLLLIERLKSTITNIPIEQAIAELNSNWPSLDRVVADFTKEEIAHPISINLWCNTVIPLLKQRALDFKEHFRLSDQDLSTFNVKDLLIIFDYISGFTPSDSCRITLQGRKGAKYYQRGVVVSEHVFEANQAAYILDQMNLSDFMNLGDRYDQDQSFSADQYEELITRETLYTTDLPIYTISLFVKNKFKQVYINCLNVPINISQLADVFWGLKTSYTKKYRERPKCCPVCGGKRILEIVYGEPTPEAEDSEARGDVIFGGCIVDNGYPSWQCNTCSATFVSKYDYDETGYGFKFRQLYRLLKGEKLE